jgi:thymidylate synthase
MTAEQQYLEALKTILKDGELVPNRTGISAYTYPHMMIRHDMADGFPLFTTKKMAWNTMKVELEFFIKGLTDKKWLQDRNCKIWNEWCNPKKVPSGLTDAERKDFQLKENDLGKVYGYQWRNFNSQGKDQLKYIVDQLKTNPTNRQLICSAWNPNEIEEQALPPCHWGFNVFTVNRKMHLSFNMRNAIQTSHSICASKNPFGQFRHKH